MPLLLAPKGELMKILHVAACGDSRHLKDIGVIAGADVVLLSDSDGNVIVRIGDTRLALDKNVARKIIVGAA